jgi:hypothetical protein
MADDKQAIVELVRMERFWRDRCEWDRPPGCYTEDSLVRTTWFHGTGREFAKASRGMLEPFYAAAERWLETAE